MKLDLSGLNELVLFGQTTGKSVWDIPLECIDLDPEQPRRTFDEAALAELAASISRVDLGSVSTGVKSVEIGRFEIGTGKDAEYMTSVGCS